MSKLSLVALIACAVSIPSAMAIGGGGGGGGHGSESEGTVLFFGSVFANSCKIHMNDKNKEVRLDPVLSTNIKSESAEQIKDFRITVRDCETYGNHVPLLAWSNSNNITSQGYLKNNVDNGAENVALVLQDRDGIDIDLTKPDNRFTQDPSSKNSGSSTIYYSFKVGYIKDDSRSRVTPGAVEARASYSINYK